MLHYTRVAGLTLFENDVIFLYSAENKFFRFLRNVTWGVCTFGKTLGSFSVRSGFNFKVQFDFLDVLGAYVGLISHQLNLIALEHDFLRLVVLRLIRNMTVTAAELRTILTRMPTDALATKLSFQACFAIRV